MSSSSRNFENYLIPLHEIKRATENFSSARYIGGGGFGSVYRGQLSDHWRNSKVAVKRLDADSHQGESEFRNELKVISKFHHENIIGFIGYCDEGGEKIIVYEFALNGSLDHHLHYPEKMSCITWAQRLEICIGAAKGLHFLHSGLGEEDRVIHRDVKSANILLDDNLVAKICDFGLSKVGNRNQLGTKVNTKVAGTEYYLDPSYRESNILQKESDIYSFGVVLFEVVSGMLVYRERRIKNEQSQYLMNIIRLYHQTEPHKLIDPNIKNHIKIRSFVSFKDIAYQCLKLNSMERPTLDTVIEKLEEASNIQSSEQYSNSIPASRSVIEALIGMLISIDPCDQRIASGEIHLFSEYFSQNPHTVASGKDWAIPGLTQLLTSTDSCTKEHALTALLNLSIDDDNKRIIISSGAVPRLVHIMEEGSNEARENAAGTIYKLSFVDGEQDTIGSAGAIPPLVLLLSEGTAEGQSLAAYSLANLCNDYGNNGRALQAGLVPILMKLLTQPQGGFKNEPMLKLLSRLLEHPEGKLAIDEAEVVPHLVELLGTTSTWYFQEVVVTVLDQLCCMDEKYLVEAQDHGVMGKLKDLLRDCTFDHIKSKARDLRRKIKDHRHVDYGSDREDRQKRGPPNLLDL